MARIIYSFALNGASPIILYRMNCDVNLGGGGGNVKYKCQLTKMILLYTRHMLIDLI